MIKVYIADDEVPVVDGMKDFINTNFKSMKVVGSAYDGQTAMEEIRQQKPDIVITDVRMPGLNGVELSKKLREEMARQYQERYEDLKTLSELSADKTGGEK